ncbi:MAG: APC family permease [Rhodospirillales bacterium]
MTQLTKSLSALRGAGLMLNIVVGAGLLSLPGLAVEAAGDHALWAWALCAVSALPLLWVFIVMGRRFPHAGGVAHFAQAAFGPAAYAAVSMIFLGAVVFGLPAIALTGAHYLAQIMPGPAVFYAAGLILAAPAVQLLSMEAAGRISSIMASSVLLFLVIFIIIGLSAAPWESETPIAAALSELNPALVIAPFTMIFFAFTGWEVAANLSEEFKNPERDFPRAMMISFAAVCCIYFAVAVVAQTADVQGDYESFFASVAERAFGAGGKIAVSLFAVLIVLANLMGAVWAVSRMVFSLSREGYIPLRLTAAENGAPVSSVFITVGLMLAVLSLNGFGWIDLGKMLSLAGQNFLLLYGITALALFKAAETRSERLVSVLALLLAGGVISIQGASILYPVFLSAAGVAVWRANRAL